ncbi:HNH endonuclease signature motif containing protein [Microbispora sp. H11081]|uniref:HNH endonuclease signature motif containing protein n=1 Tax=Microbispora sp. H11081 TaxID=2729107 RepID=UPI0014763721|nr:HNH endonuclease signature motif containing protein [Microbispora sp. H11081]
MDLSDLDPERHHRSNSGDDGWWDRLVADSPLWSSDGSAARDEDVENDAPTDSGAAGGKGRSSWVLVGSLRESAQALALAPVPEAVEICLAEAEDLLFVRDRITCALAERVGRVHRAGQARQHGHASTRSWLRTAGGMTVGGAGRLLTLGIELARLPRVREMFAAGGLAAGVVEAICAAVSGLSDEQARLAEPILVELAGRAGAAEVAKAGRYLRAVLDPDGEDRDERADYARRSLRVRPGKGGGLEGEFYLPREAAARLRALLDAYARPRAEGDDRSLAERQADAFIALLEQQITTELLVLVNAESLPTDPDPEAGPEPDVATGTDADTTGGSTVGGASGSVADGAGGTATGGAAGLRDEEFGGDMTGRAQARTGQRSEPRREPQQSDQEHSRQEQDEAHQDSPHPPQPGWPKQEEPQESARRRQEGRSRESRWGEWCSPDPAGDTHAHHTHAGPRPAREVPHAHSSSQQSSGEQGSGETPRGEQTPGAAPGTSPGASRGAGPEAALGVGLGMVPGLLLATGQVLPVTGVHRLARTSTLMRIVMDADGQVLDMGRKVRLATPAQRRAIFARYATCWIDGCPLPATMCQIDHADNWSTGGLTDLKLLGPACQFHNRDRYQHPHRYTRHKTGKDRWAFTYHGRIRRMQV